MPDSSVGAVRKVAKLDSGTHIVAAREPGGTWYRLQRRTRFTRQTARILREAGISEVVLRRSLRRATFPLAWSSQRS